MSAAKSNSCVHKLPIYACDACSPLAREPRQRTKPFIPPPQSVHTKKSQPKPKPKPRDLSLDHKYRSSSSSKTRKKKSKSGGVNQSVVRRRLKKAPRASKGQRKAIERLSGVYPKNVRDFSSRRARQIIEGLQAGESTVVTLNDGGELRLTPIRDRH